jgi:hypothetical protein
VRTVAERNEYVGKGLMINVLPKASLTSAGLHVAGPPLAGAQTFLYVPRTGRSAVQLGPLMTCGGMVLSDFRAAPIAEEREAPAARLRRDQGTSVRRVYLAPITGTGTEHDPYRANVHGHNHSAVIPSDEKGHPLHRVALVLVSAEDHTQLEADPAIVPIADLADFDVLVDDLSLSRRERLASVAALYAVDTAGLVRAVVRRLGEVFQPDFHEDNLWVG